jgi:2-isopropylmalate synthase
VPRFFDVEELPGDVERRYNAVGELVTVSEAVVKVKVDGEEILISVAEGNGPVNALDLALRKDLGRYQSIIGSSNWSTSRCVSSTAAPARSRAC